MVPILQACYNFVDVMTQFALPLLIFLCTFHRYIIICYPHLLQTFSSKTKTNFVLILIICFCIGMSVHEFWDQAFWLQLDHEKKYHEHYTGIIMMVVMALEVFLVCFGCVLFTTKMNTVLDRSIFFLQYLNSESHNKRSIVYTRVRRFNISLLSLNTAFMGLRLTCFYFKELYFYLGHYPNGFSRIISYCNAINNLLGSMEIFLYPLFIVCYQSTVKNCLKRMTKKWNCIATDNR